MQFSKILLTASILTLLSFGGRAQDYSRTRSILATTYNDSLGLQKIVSEKRNPFPVRALFLPAVMIAYGFASLESPTIHYWDKEMREEVYLERMPRHLNIDTYLQFAPAVAVYGLNLAGIKGKNNFRDRTMIYLMSNLILNSTVFVTKNLTHWNRPDGSNDLSFPSGHSAEAFASAEFLSQEYKNVSPWYGVAGYALAATTGYLRIYNNRHWLSDVIGGAGIGIASTKISYWLYPLIQRNFFKDKSINTLIMPSWQNNSPGITMVHLF